MYDNQYGQQDLGGGGSGMGGGMQGGMMGGGGGMMGGMQGGGMQGGYDQQVLVHFLVWRPSQAFDLAAISQKSCPDVQCCHTSALHVPAQP